MIRRQFRVGAILLVVSVSSPTMCKQAAHLPVDSSGTAPPSVQTERDSLSQVDSAVAALPEKGTETGSAPAGGMESLREMLGCGEPMPHWIRGQLVGRLWPSNNVRETNMTGAYILLQVGASDSAPAYNEIQRVGADGLFEFKKVPSDTSRLLQIDVLDPRVEDGRLRVFGGSIGYAISDCLLPPRLKSIPIQALRIKLES